MHSTVQWLKDVRDIFIAKLRKRSCNLMYVHVLSFLVFRFQAPICVLCIPYYCYDSSALIQLHFTKHHTVGIYCKSCNCANFASRMH